MNDVQNIGSTPVHISGLKKRRNCQKTKWLIINIHLFTLIQVNYANCSSIQNPQTTLIKSAIKPLYYSIILIE